MFIVLRVFRYFCIVRIHSRLIFNNCTYKVVMNYSLRIKILTVKNVTV